MAVQGEVLQTGRYALSGCDKLTNDADRYSLVGMGDRTEYYQDWYEKNREELLARRRDKYASDKGHAEKCRKRARNYRREVRTGVREKPAAGVARGPIGIVVRGKSLEAWTIPWLADGIGRSVQTVNYWTKHGLFPDTPIKTPGGNRLYTKEMISAVEEILEQRDRGLVSRTDPDFKRQIASRWKKLGVYKWSFAQP